MELIFRATGVYFFLLLLIRATGKRELGELSTMDFVLLLMISEALQEGLVGFDLSITGGFILASTLGFWHAAITFASYRSQTLRDVLNGVPVLLINKGKPDETAMRAERVPLDDIESEARQVGIDSLEQVEKAVLESTGKISIIPKQGSFRSAAPKKKQEMD